jgi:hypothetical protein
VVEEQLELFPRGPMCDDEVWGRATELKSAYRADAVRMVKLRLSDDLLSYDDSQFFIKVRQALNFMSHWGGFH